MRTSRFCLASLLFACTFALIGLGGCSALTGAQDAAPPVVAATGMGGPMATGAASGGMVEGVVANADQASLLAADVHGTASGVRVDSVTSPAEGWLVVHSAVSPYPAIGTARIPAGRSTGHQIPLFAADGTQAFVALHVDRGTPGKFEFNYARPRQSPDTLVNVDRAPVQVPVKIEGLGIDLLANSALLLVTDQKVKNRSLTVDYLLAPGASWISVNLLEKGLPGRRLGLVARPAGEQQSITVPLKGAVSSGDTLVVTVHADRAVPGRFEFVSSDPLAGADQPYIAAGVIVSQRVRVK